MHNPDLSGRVAAITGASSGIGEATALTLAARRRGGRRWPRAAATASRRSPSASTSDGGRAIAIETDVTDEAQANAFVTRTKEELGRLDILVNNAGVMLLGPVIGADTSEWRQMIEVNLLGLLYCTHAALPIMGEQGSGHIVNVSSVAGRFANFGSAVYNLTKFGVNAFSEALRQEVAAANVKVTVIEPGYRHHRAARATTRTRWWWTRSRTCARRSASRSRRATSPRRSCTRSAGPERVAVNEVLVRPAGQRR